MKTAAEWLDELGRNEAGYHEVGEADIDARDIETLEAAAKRVCPECRRGAKLQQDDLGKYHVRVAGSFLAGVAV